MCARSLLRNLQNDDKRNQKRPKKWRGMPCLWTGSHSIVKMPTSPKVTYRFEETQNQILTGHFVNIGTLIQKFIWRR